jgi:hypothetical protein
MKLYRDDGDVCVHTIERLVQSSGSTVAVSSEVWALFRLVAGTVGSNPTQAMDVFPRFFGVVLSCVQVEAL